MEENNITTAVARINKDLNVELSLISRIVDFRKYEAKIENTMPHVFKEIKMELSWFGEAGKVEYYYTHPNGSSNSYTVASINKNGEVKYK